MRMIRNAALAAAAALGLGLFAIGCGPVAIPTDTSKVKDVVDKTKDEAAKKAEEAKKVAEDAKKKAEELAGKVKTAADDAGKEVEGIEGAIKSLGDTIAKEEKEGKDVEKLKQMNALKGEATGLLGKLKEKIGELAKLKDIGGIEGIMKAVKEMAAGLKDKLKAYMPAPK